MKPHAMNLLFCTGCPAAVMIDNTCEGLLILIQIWTWTLIFSRLPQNLLFRNTFSFFIRRTNPWKFICKAFLISSSTAPCLAHVRFSDLVLILHKNICIIWSFNLSSACFMPKTCHGEVDGMYCTRHNPPSFVSHWSWHKVLQVLDDGWYEKTKSVLSSSFHTRYEQSNQNAHGIKSTFNIFHFDWVHAALTSNPHCTATWF